MYQTPHHSPGVHYTFWTVAVAYLVFFHIDQTVQLSFTKNFHSTAFLPFLYEVIEVMNEEKFNFLVCPTDTGRTILHYHTCSHFTDRQYSPENRKAKYQRIKTLLSFHKLHIYVAIWLPWLIAKEV